MPNCYVRAGAGEFRGYLFTGNAWQRYAKRNGIGAQNPANCLVNSGKPVYMVLWSTNTAWYLYSFWALLVLYEVQLDNKEIYWKKVHSDIVPLKIKEHQLQDTQTGIVKCMYCTATVLRERFSLKITKMYTTKSFGLSQLLVPLTDQSSRHV